jgi:hypothetical protein
MLLAAGVDRLSLAQRLRALDEAQRETFSSQYAVRRAIVARRVDEAHFCESYLLQRGFAEELEEGWVQALPASANPLAGRDGEAPVDFAAGARALEQILSASPVEVTRILAAIGLLRHGRASERVLEWVARALHGAQERLALEAALAFATWRSAPYLRDPRPVAVLARSALADARLAPWAAAVCAWPHWMNLHARMNRDEAAKELQALAPILREGLSHSDRDLRVTSALLLGDEPTLGATLDDPASEGALVELAWHTLARRQSPRVAAALRQGPDKLRATILKSLEQPLEPAILEALLEAIARPGSPLRARPRPDHERTLRVLRAGLPESPRGLARANQGRTRRERCVRSPRVVFGAPGRKAVRIPTPGPRDRSLSSGGDPCVESDSGDLAR